MNISAPIYLISLIFLGFLGSLAQASSFEICEYKLKVLAVSKTQVKVDLIETIVSPGFNAKRKTLACQGKIQNNLIPLSEVSIGQNLLKTGKTVKGEWSSYSAMGPNGPVGGISWKFYSINK